MSARRTSFDKLQRERGKKAKASAKRERRLDGDRSAGATEAPAEGVVGIGGEIPPARLLELVAQVHRRFEAEEISYEEYEETKAELLARLPVD